ncbi:MAG: hypothetical protein OXT64_15830 [Gammaproteobacteria bacterium]|nr:hypothetical protein [Gammaproteobacteria bacterium]
MARIEVWLVAPASGRRIAEVPAPGRLAPLSRELLKSGTHDTRSDQS